MSSVLQTVYDALKTCMEGQITREELSGIIEKHVDTALRDAGAGGIGDINDIGMIAALYYLYGLGVIPAETVRSFINNEQRHTMDKFAIRLRPTDEGEAPLKVEILFLKKRDISNMSA